MTKQELEYGKILLNIENLEIGFDELLASNPKEDIVVGAKVTMASLEAFRQEIHKDLGVLEMSEVLEKSLDYLNLPSAIYWALRNKGYLWVKDVVNEERNSIFLYLGSGSYEKLRMSLLLRGIPSNDRKIQQKVVSELVKGSEFKPTGELFLATDKTFKDVIREDGFKDVILGKTAQSAIKVIGGGIIYRVDAVGLVDAGYKLYSTSNGDLIMADEVPSSYLIIGN